MTSLRMQWVNVLVNASCVIAGIVLMFQGQPAFALPLLTFAAGQHTPQPRVSNPPPPPAPPEAQ